jgi:hypothetical protein
MAADSLETAAAEAARQLGTAAHALATAFFVVLHGKLYLEFWHPMDAVQRPLLRGHMHALAIKAAGESPAAVGRHLEYHAPGLMSRAYVLPLQDRLTGVLCLTFPPGAERGVAPATEEFRRAVRLVGMRLLALQAAEAERRKSGQYERWFHVNDRQIRALDGERQKFVALASSIDTCVFVADPEGFIRWTSPPLVARVPPPDGGSWIGHKCEELCTRATGGPEAACGVCPFLQATPPDSEDGHAAVSATAEGGERPPVVAIPIVNLEGKPQEVMIVLGDLSRIEGRVAA